MSTFKRKLEMALLEAGGMNRRDFLRKSASGITAAATGDLGKLAGTIAPAVVAAFSNEDRERVAGVIWNLIDQDESGAHSWNIKPGPPKATPAEVKRYIDELFSG